MRKTLLSIDNASCGYNAGRRAKPVLSGVSLTVKEGEIVVLAGPNGGGKTTLLKTAGGIIKPLSGGVKIGGRDIFSMSYKERARETAFLFQGTLINWPFTVEEIVRQGRYAHQKQWGTMSAAERRAEDEAVQKALDEAGLSGYEERLVTEISGGELQRVLIARQSAQGAALLLLDEPVNNLDPKYQSAVMNLIKKMTQGGEKTCGVLMSLHDLNLASLYADRIIFLAKGAVHSAGTPDEVISPKTIEAVYGARLPVGAHIDDTSRKIVFPALPCG